VKGFFVFELRHLHVHAGVNLALEVRLEHLHYV
jgi:hypothetical protein